ncbi:MAG: hypothetical protein HC933_05590 [Pleurocapsa sp. SU_196_0]|nr:hypothetical protein [Pleurocapsa sp. SU_196_0]
MDRNGGTGTNTLVQAGNFSGTIVVNMATGFVTGGASNFAQFSNFQNVSVNGQPVTSGEQINRVVMGQKVGSTVRLEIVDGNGRRRTDLLSYQVREIEDAKLREDRRSRPESTARWTGKRGAHRAGRESGSRRA